ncbi:MAG: beta-lactamase family protein [Bacteroidia bacterium]|nr:beta-lactamase family protein [Bacteroidia bacterium]
MSDLCFAQTIVETDTNYTNQQFESEVNEAKKLITELMTEKDIPGLSITVAKKNEILWAEGFGFSDLENKTPVRLNSKFRIGSISKSLTSIALGKLVEEGKMNWHDAIRKFVPYFPKKKYPITIQALASHASGIRNYNYKSGEYFSDKPYSSIEESINIFKEDSLLFQPKTKYSYSTYGYVLLSAGIEGATNQSYLAYMHNFVFTPMRMHNTVPDFNDSIITDRARCYQLKEGVIINASYIDNSNKWAGAGFLSTSLDLAKMSQNLLKYEYLKESTLKTLWAPTELSNGEKTNHCLGWRRDIDDLGRNYIHHGGSSVGGRSFLLIYPDKDVIVAITCNLFTRFNESFVLKIAEKFIK